MLDARVFQEIENEPGSSFGRNTNAEISDNPQSEVKGARPQPPEIVRVEANFLRLPLFVLDKKHMRTTDGIHCEGTFRRNEQAIPFSFQATRNADTYYPGPASRSAHFALLAMATDGGLPISNPIAFTWHELCSRIGIQCSGRTVQKLREALVATKGLMLRSHHALYSKADNQTLSTDDLERVINVYDELEFFGSKRSDGSTADINAVWLSRWYVDNLNALYSAPLNFDLWRTLNERSLIGSRLYEFLFFKFYAGHPQLRFNYATLVKFIPVRTERYLSDARKQLCPALHLLVKHDVLTEVQWLQSTGGEPQLLFTRGPAVAGSASRNDMIADEVSQEDFVVTQVQDVRTPEAEIVTEFHRLFGHDDYRPSKAELALARGLIGRYGASQLKAMVPNLVKRLRLKWPDAKTFASVSRYIEDVAGELRRKQVAEQRAAEAEKREQQETKTEAQQAKELAELRTMWATLPEWDREAIQTKVLQNQPRSAARFPRTVERWCLQELARRLKQAA